MDRKFVNPAALKEVDESFSEREGFIIVRRLLDRKKVEAYHIRTRELRGTYKFDSIYWEVFKSDEYLIILEFSYSQR